jgi:type VI protein secretion system component Hcp
MATDAYIKFGESSDLSPYKTPLPAIEGDSTDYNHYWWCELRGYDFALEAGERDSASEGDKDKEKPKPTFHKVTIKKRVDWASTQLFMKCCAAAQATARKLTGDQDQGLIDRVTIEICKQAAESKIGPSDPKDDKFWFVTVRYFGVRIVGYSIDMSRPEPDETITFVFEKLDVEYQPTDPRTGLKINGAVSRAIGMKNYTNANAQTAQSSGAGTSTTTSASTGAAAAAAGAAAGGADGNGAANNGSSGNPSPTEAAVNANFPGLWGGNGFGILPD